MKRGQKIFLMILGIIAAISFQDRYAYGQDKPIGKIFVCVKADPERDIFVGENQAVYNHSNIDYYFLTDNFENWNIDKFIEEKINLSTGKKSVEEWGCSKDVPGIVSTGDFTEGKWLIKFYSTGGKLLGESMVFEVKF